MHMHISRNLLVNEFLILGYAVSHAALPLAMVVAVLVSGARLATF